MIPSFLGNSACLIQPIGKKEFSGVGMLPQAFVSLQEGDGAGVVAELVLDCM